MAKKFPRKPIKIFLSYRRQDSSAEAGRLYDHLEEAFGKFNVVKDVMSFQPGEDFVKAIDQSLQESSVLLALIGNEWISAIGSSGSRRIDEPDDYVRREIESALKSNTRVIPILLGDAQMPEAKALPETIAKLAYINAARLRPDPDFKHDCQILIRELAQATPKKSRIKLVGLSLGIISLLGMVAWFVRPAVHNGPSIDIGKYPETILDIRKQAEKEGKQIGEIPWLKALAIQRTKQFFDIAKPQDKRAALEFLVNAGLHDKIPLNDINLSGTKILDMYLQDANLHGSNLSNADLTEAKLMGVDLRGAAINRGTKLRNVSYDRCTLVDPSLWAKSTELSWQWKDREGDCRYK
jgi:hypothetical protein